jgi:hypothetical protein
MDGFLHSFFVHALWHIVLAVKFILENGVILLVDKNGDQYQAFDASELKVQNPLPNNVT